MEGFFPRPCCKEREGQGVHFNRAPPPPPHPQCQGGGGTDKGQCSKGPGAGMEPSHCRSTLYPLYPLYPPTAQWRCQR